MRAWQVGPTFGLDHLQLGTRDPAVLRPGQVRVRLHAASLNFRDLLMVQGAYNPKQRLPLVPCSDGAGEVVEVGEGVSRFAVGDRVCPTFVQGWVAGEPDRAMLMSTLGGPLDGTLRPELVAVESGLVRIPDHLSFVEAATLPCAAVTAWRALVTHGGVKAGDTVLTQGTGGVSLFALQIAKLHGARVMITSSSDEKLELARRLGADLCVNYRSDPGWGATAAKWAGGRGVDHVIELGGSETLDQSLRAVRPGGTVHLIGVLSGPRAEVLLPRIFMAGVRVQGVLVGCARDFEALLRALDAAPQVRPQVDGVLPFDEVPAAFARMQAGQHAGKIVIDLAQETA